MIEKLIATGNFVLVKRDPPPSEKGGFIIPDIAKKKPSTGLILGRGGLVKDKKIKKGRKAVFANGNGVDLELEDGEIVTVLNGEQIISVYVIPSKWFFTRKG